MTVDLRAIFALMGQMDSFPLGFFNKVDVPDIPPAVLICDKYNDL